MTRFNLYSAFSTLIIIFNLFTQTFAEEILGCGGFVKSHADIDFSKVEVEL